MVGALLLAVFSPRRFVRMVFRPVLALLYRKQVVGLENFPDTGGCVVVSNHVSWIDGILILWMLPRNIRFVVDGGNFGSAGLRWLAAAFDTILMRPSPKSIARALRTARDSVGQGHVVGLFPEGTITRTGQLQSFKPGVSKIVKASETPIIPMWLDGMWGSVFSFSGGRFFFKRPTGVRRRRVTLYLGEPLPAGTSPGKIRSRVLALGARAAIEHREEFPLLAVRAMRAWRRAGRRQQAADSTGVEASGWELLIRTLALRRVLRREVLGGDERYVGVMLPPSVAGVAVNVALAVDRRVSANLNYTAKTDVINHCTETLGIKHVLTSKRFLEKMELELEAPVVLLESLRDKVSRLDKAVAFVQAVLVPLPLLARGLGLSRVDPDDLLTVIFTSGSTGMPKGVMLTQANVSHNVDAIERAIRLDERDTVLGVLPFFHSFGFSVTLWAAITLGPRAVYHFNPLDARQIGKLAARYGVTVLLGTPTFLRSYMRRVEPDQFETLDVVVVGAEKMPLDLFDAFQERFGVRPIEGYGTTELSPLVSVNIPPSRSSARHQPDLVEGSVGRPVPGVAVRIRSPEEEDGDELDVGEDGMLLVTGPNVMRGYANQDGKTRESILDGWYITGDVGHVDPDGFLHITGRLSRFSKIGGEMVPHVTIEQELTRQLREGPDDEQLRVCVTSAPDEKKGERLIVLQTPTEKTADELRQGLRDAGLPNLFVPAAENFYEVDEIPMLGSGKLDLKRAKEMAAELTSAKT